MAFVEELLKKNILTGLAVGAGIILVAPTLLPAIARAARPAMKAAMRGGVALYDRSREAMADVTEMTQDIMAEVRAEMHAERAATAAGGAAAAGAAAGTSARTTETDGGNADQKDKESGAKDDENAG